MAKVITIGDEIYKRLAKMKRKKGLSFTKLLEQLLNFYEARKESTGIRSLKGSLKPRDVMRQRLRRVMDG